MRLLESEGFGPTRRYLELVWSGAAVSRAGGGRRVHGAVLRERRRAGPHRAAERVLRRQLGLLPEHGRRDRGEARLRHVVPVRRRLRRARRAAGRLRVDVQERRHRLDRHDRCPPELPRSGSGKGGVGRRHDLPGGERGEDGEASRRTTSMRPRSGYTSRPASARREGRCGTSGRGPRARAPRPPAACARDGPASVTYRSAMRLAVWSQPIVRAFALAALPIAALSAGLASSTSSRLAYGSGQRHGTR